MAVALGLTEGPQELGRSQLGTPLVSRAHSSWQHPRLSKHRSKAQTAAGWSSQWSSLDGKEGGSSHARP